MVGWMNVLLSFFLQINLVFIVKIELIGINIVYLLKMIITDVILLKLMPKMPKTYTVIK